MREKQRPYYNFYRVKQGINNLILYALDEQRAIDQYCSCQSFARRESASAEKLESKVIAWGNISDPYVDYEINDADHWAIKLGIVESFVEPIL